MHSALASLAGYPALVKARQPASPGGQRYFPASPAGQRPKGNRPRTADQPRAGRHSVAGRQSPIAVIGMGCRLPGATGTDQLWELLSTGQDATREVPASRFAVDELYAPMPGTPGHTVSTRGGFLDDSAFACEGALLEQLGLSADEAKAVDPQQLLMLATARDALEDAGLDYETLAGSRTGVFVGASNGDYWDVLRRGGLEGLGLDAYTGGHQRGLLSGRLSYAFDLRGPSVTLDAAQASSLVAVHLACQSLRSGDAWVALAGGVNLMLDPVQAVMLSQAGKLAPDGHCKFGDAAADGFVRADGAGVVVLKRLADALADGDPVRAVIAGSAVSNNGRSELPLTEPSQAGQELAMRWAYEAAGISPGEVDYVEAHGTGTRIDQVELTALSEVLSIGRMPGRPCLVGSIKSNIGHAEAAAGVAGLIKTVLCLEYEHVPPSLHFTTPHPEVDWDRVPLVVPTALRPLQDRGRPLVAAVNGQSISCANAHLVLRQPGPPPPLRRPPA